MANFDFEDILYARKKKPETFNFDALVGPGIYNLLYESDLQSLYNIATSLKYSAALKKKYQAINDILRPRGFAHFHRGTNRVVYKHYENPNILIKVPIDVAGCADGMMEFRNQNLLKPFVTKVFDVHPSGVSVHERVMPITSYADFARFAYDYFQLVSHVFLGRFVMDDIGEGSFMNWGFRKGFGLVLLDFPYLYELDYQRLICRKVSPETGMPCLGEIDYDDGFNHLICTKCGASYNAKDIGKFIQDHQINVLKEDITMAQTSQCLKINLMANGKVVKSFGSVETASDVIVHKNNIRYTAKPNQHTTQPPAPKTNIIQDVPRAFKPVRASKQEEKEEIPSIGTAAFNEDGTVSVSDKQNPQEPEADKAEEAVEDNFKEVAASDADRFPEEEEQQEPESTDEQEAEPEPEPQEQQPIAEVDQNETDPVKIIIQELVASGLSEGVVENIAAKIRYHEYSIQMLEKDIQQYLLKQYQNPSQIDIAKEMYVKYMNAASKLTTAINAQKEQIKAGNYNPVEANNIQQEASEEKHEEAGVESYEQTVYNKYYEILDSFIKDNADPKGWIIDVDPNAEITREMIESSLKESVNAVIDDELGKDEAHPMVADKDNFVNNLVAKCMAANDDHIRAWISDRNV